MSYFEFPHTRTYDSDLGWLIKKVTSYDEVIQTLNSWISENEPKLEDFEKLYDMLLSGDLPAGVQEGINKWMQLNAVDIVGKLVKSVFFEITDDGHFVAWIPDSWNDITFNTTYYDIVLSDHPEYGYGHLVLSY